MSVVFVALTVPLKLFARKPPATPAPPSQLDPEIPQWADRIVLKAASCCVPSHGFAPAKFGIAEHARTAFPLDGKHLAAPCGACHGFDHPRTQFAIRFGAACAALLLTSSAATLEAQDARQAQVAKRPLACAVVGTGSTERSEAMCDALGLELGRATVLVDDGSCGPGKIKKVTGGSDTSLTTGKPVAGGSGRKRTCIKK